MTPGEAMAGAPLTELCERAYIDRPIDRLTPRPLCCTVYSARTAHTIA